VGATWYVDPVWAAKANGESNGSSISGYNTAVWMDRIGAIEGPADGDGMGLREHLDETLAQGANLFMFVVYDLPNRDCAALASNGELRIADGGFQRYQDEYIAPIAEILSDPAYNNIRIIAIIEVDSLPNLVTNLDEADCNEANGAGGYVDGIQHALNVLSEIPNVYSYVDIAHSGWLGWSDNFSEAITLIGNAVKGTNNGVNSISGFASNSANYTPVTEPYLSNPDLQVGGGQIKSSDFYEFNSYLDELSFVQDWRSSMINNGFPNSLGMLIDTGRNGWGGAARPSGASSSDDLETYVNESRVDRRQHRGNWCNQSGGVGFRPQAAPQSGVDAYVWIKPQGESDGVSDPNFEIDPNDPNKQHDPMCDPGAENRYADEGSGIMTGAMDNAPHAGRWFPEAFQTLVENAYPAL